MARKELKYGPTDDVSSGLGGESSIGAGFVCYMALGIFLLSFHDRLLGAVAQFSYRRRCNFTTLQTTVNVTEVDRLFSPNIVQRLRTKYYVNYTLPQIAIFPP